MVKIDLTKKWMRAALNVRHLPNPTIFHEWHATNVNEMLVHEWKPTESLAVRCLRVLMLFVVVLLFYDFWSI